MVTDFSGVHSALITPFDANGNLDLGAFSEAVAWQKMAGIHGLVLGASTGEGATLSIEERAKLVECAINSHSGSMKIIAGAGSNCTKTAIAWQDKMAQAGAHATLQVTPYYNRPTQLGLYAHFSAIAKSSSLPIILYNVAVRTGVEMAAETVAKLALEHPSIVGIKEANPSCEKLTHMMALIKPHRPDFAFLSGEDSAMLSFLGLGADGIISTSSQVAAREMLAIYNASKSGDLAYAQKIAQKLNGFFQLMFTHPNPIPIKTVMAAMGMVQKSWRLPLCALSEAEEAILLGKCQPFNFLHSFQAKGFRP